MPTKTKPKAVPASRRSISEQLRGAILDRDLTAYRLGKETGIDPGLIQRFLNGERDIRMATADRLAEVLGLRLGDGPRGRGRPMESRRHGTAGVALAPGACQAAAAPEVPESGPAAEDCVVAPPEP